MSSPNLATAFCRPFCYEECLVLSTDASLVADRGKIAILPNN